MELNRRGFIKCAAAVAGILLLQPPGLSVSKKVQADSSEVSMLVDVSKCVGCWWCAVACHDCNNLPGNINPDPESPPELCPSTWTTLFTKKEDGKWKFRRHSCMHCTEAVCVEVCPTGALSHNELGFVQYDSEKCSGCGYCAEHCPFEVPNMNCFNIIGSGCMAKCVFCMDRVSEGKQPACAEACPTGATRFGIRDELLEYARERIVELSRTYPKATLYGDDELGGLHVIYILDDSPESYGLPADPEVPITTTVRQWLQWIGIGAAAAVVAAFGFNYLVARMRISRENKEQDNDGTAGS